MYPGILIDLLQSHTEEFMDVLFKSMATQNITLEHDYASLLFSIDRLRHPLLSNLPIDPPAADGDYHLTKQAFVEKRPAMLESECCQNSDVACG